jgi:hypothetical protein
LNPATPKVKSLVERKTYRRIAAYSDARRSPKKNGTGNEAAVSLFCPVVLRRQVIFRFHYLHEPRGNGEAKYENRCTASLKAKCHDYKYVPTDYVVLVSVVTRSWYASVE